VGIFVTQQDIIDWINEAQLEITQESDMFSLDFPCTIAQYATDGGIKLANDKIYIKMIMFGKTLLTYRDRALLASMADASASGRPVYWYQFTDGQDVNDPNKTRTALIRVWPAPDSSQSDNLIVTVGVAPTPLTVISNPIDLPEVYHPAVMNFCVMRAHERVKDWQGFKVAQEAFQSGLAKRVDEGETPNEEWPVIIDVMG
jgi:hypothetical protein